MVLAAEQVNAIQRQLFVADGLSDDLLAAAYLILKNDGLLPVVFYQGEPTLREFLAIHDRPGTHYLGAFVRPTLDTAGPELAGLGWLTGITDVGGARKCEVGFAYFRKYQREGIPLELTRLMLDHVFEVMGMQVVYGTTPEPNRAALVFGRRLGFTQLPPLPLYCAWDGKPCAAILSYLTRTAWEKKGRQS